MASSGLRPESQASGEPVPAGALVGAAIQEAIRHVLHEVMREEFAEAEKRSVERALPRVVALVGEQMGVVRVMREMKQAVEGMKGGLEAVAEGNYELRKENEELKQLAAGGYLNFVRAVEPRDFCRFIYILAHGDRAKAARKLGEKPRRFYEAVDSWAERGVEYRRMFALIQCRKTSMRKGTVALGQSLQSGGTQDEGENPETVQAVLEQLESGALDQRDYPQVLQDVLNTLGQMNGHNWPVIHKRVMAMIKEELPQ